MLTEEKVVVVCTQWNVTDALLRNVGNVYVFFGALFHSNIFVEEKQTLLPQKTKT